MHSGRRVKFSRSHQRRTWLRRLFLVLILLLIGLGSRSAILAPEHVLAQRVPPTPTPIPTPLPPAEEPPAEEPPPEQSPPAEEPPAEEPPAEEPPAEPPAEEPPAEEPPAEPPAEEPPAEEPPAEEPPAEEPPAEEPPAEEPPAEPPAEEPPAEPPAEEPPAEEPPAEPPAPSDDPAPPDDPVQPPPAEEPPAQQDPPVDTPPPPTDDPDPQPAEEGPPAEAAPAEDLPVDDPADAPVSDDAPLPLPTPALDFQVTSALPPTVYTVNLTVLDADTGATLNNFSYLVNEDNSGAPVVNVNGTNVVLNENSPSLKPMASYSPIVAAGNQSTAGSIGLPDIDPSLANPSADQVDRFLISVRAPGYKMWGQHVHFFDPDTNPGQPTAAEVTVELIPEPLPMASLRLFVFRDYRPVDGFPSVVESLAGLEGFHVLLEDVGGEVVVDFDGNIICTDQFIGQAPQNEPGDCRTNSTGDVFIEGIPRGIYEIKIIPPDGTDWVQTTTFEGTKVVDAWLEEGSEGLGAPDELVAEPFVETAYFFGFTNDMDWGDPEGLPPGDGTITGQIRNLVPFPPFEQLTFGEPVYRPWITLTDIGRTDQQVYRTRGDENGNFVIPDVPAGTYQLAYWDDPLDYIIAFRTVHVEPGETIDMNSFDPNGVPGLGIFRWFGWVSGFIYADENRNGFRDCGTQPLTPDDPANESCEAGFAGLELLTRFRDGSVFQANVTDGTNRPGYYELPEIRGPLGKFVTNEVDFGRYARTGHALHREQDSLFGRLSSVANQEQVDPNFEVGGGLILSQLVWEGRRTFLDWGKDPYLADNPDTPEYDGENGGISGIVIYGTTRNEFEARLQAAEDYEPGIPDVTVRLWSVLTDPNTGEPMLNADGQPQRGVLLNEVQTDSWQDPGIENPDNPAQCDVLRLDGTPMPGTTPAFIAEHCLEVPQVGNETKPGAYDGGWAFESYFPDGFPNGTELSPLIPGDYLVEVIEPHFHQMVKEEDNNTVEGNAYFFQPQFPPPDCVGPLHQVPGPGSDFANNYPASPYIGQMMPLCNLRLVTLQDQQNAGVEFFLYTDSTIDHNPMTQGWDSPNSVPIPGRFYGLVEDDIRFNLDPNSIGYGEPRGVPNVPISVRDYRDRILTLVHTDENGYYEVMLPSTGTADCPIPAGVCPQMYKLIINDPGDFSSPNPNFNKNYLTEPFVFQIFPGKMRHTDTPVDPINTLVCSVPPETPQIFVADVVTGPDSGFDITLKGTRFGTFLAPTVPLPTPNDPVLEPTVTLDPDGDGPLLPVELAVANWVPTTPFGPDNIQFTDDDFEAIFEDEVTVSVPGGLTPGQHQLHVTNNHSGLTSENGLTIHILGGGYNPPVVTVSPPANPGERVIQAAIDGAPSGALIVIGPGTYRENLIMDKRVKIQGHGPGGAVGAGNLEVIDCPFPGDPADVCPPPTLPGEEPFSHVPGSVIDARFYSFDVERQIDWAASLPGSISGPTPVPGGAGITIVAPSDTEFDAATDLDRARIDGMGITGARGAAGGGIYAHAFIRNLIVSNNILEVNSSTHGGAISLGQPVATGGLVDNENDNAHMHNNRILSNGGLFFAGAVGIFNGADNYEFNNNDVCGNFSAEYGGGVSHYGLSLNGNIHDNLIYFNEAFDEGGGLMVRGDPGAAPPLGIGTGPLNIESNLFHLNVAWDDGGGIMLLDPLNDRIDIVNNIVTNNVAGDFGGGMTLDNSANATIINNTVAGNVSTHTAEDSILGEAHAAGIGSHQHSNLTSWTPIDGSSFSDPVMFNNIVWDNLAYRYDPIPPGDPVEAPGFDLEPTAYIDFEVFPDNGPGTLTPNHSFISDVYPPGGPQVGIGNFTGEPEDLEGAISPDASFIRRMAAARIEIQVVPNFLNPTELILLVDRKEGTFIEDVDFHLNSNSPAIDVGAASLDVNGTTYLAPCDDIDDDARPANDEWDMGADEQPGAIPTGTGEDCDATDANLPPIVEAGPNQSIDDFDTIMDGLVTDDGVTPVTLTWELVAALGLSGAEVIFTPPTETFQQSAPYATTPLAEFNLPGGEYLIRLTADDGVNAPVFDEVTVAVQTLPESEAVVPTADLYLTLNRNTGSAGIGDNGLRALDDDILGWIDTGGPQGDYVMVFDGSDVGLAGTDVVAFDLDLRNELGTIIIDPGQILMAFESTVTIDGAFTLDGAPLTVAPQDIVQFIPETLGSNTEGLFRMFLDGSSHGLTTNGESIDAISRLDPNGVVISTIGSMLNTDLSQAGGPARDEDLVFYNISQDEWSIYFDGSNVGLGDGNNEDVGGAHTNAATSVIHLTTRGVFGVPYPPLSDLSGANEDVFTCTVGTTGEDNTTCDFAPLLSSFDNPLFFQGAVHGITTNSNNGNDLRVDGLTLPPGVTLP